MAEYLDSLVAGLSTPALVVALAATVAGLAKGADWMVDSAVALSERWGVPRVVIGATIVSLGTTTPEAVVSVVAALQGRSEMALGNAVGSIICNTGLILGIGCLIRPLPLDLQVVNRQGWGKVATGILLVLVCLPWAAPASAFTAGGTLPQTAGWVFLGLLVVYMVWSVRLARAGVGAGGAEGGEAGGLGAALGTLGGGVALVIVSSAVLVAVAAELAARMNVPPSIIAATLVAFGTSLPELTVVVTATIKGHGELAVGNVIGADVLNVLFVAGGSGGGNAGRAGRGLHLLRDALPGDAVPDPRLPRRHPDRAPRRAAADGRRRAARDLRGGNGVELPAVVPGAGGVDAAQGRPPGAAGAATTSAGSVVPAACRSRSGRAVGAVPGCLRDLVP